MNKKDLTERDICSKFIGPAVKRAGEFAGQANLRNLRDMRNLRDTEFAGQIA